MQEENIPTDQKPDDHFKFRAHQTSKSQIVNVQDGKKYNLKKNKDKARQIYFLNIMKIQKHHILKS